MAGEVRFLSIRLIAAIEITDVLLEPEAWVVVAGHAAVNVDLRFFHLVRRKT